MHFASHNEQLTREDRTECIRDHRRCYNGSGVAFSELVRDFIRQDMKEWLKYPKAIVSGDTELILRGGSYLPLLQSSSIRSLLGKYSPQGYTSIEK